MYTHSPPRKTSVSISSHKISYKLIDWKVIQSLQEWLQLLSEAKHGLCCNTAKEGAKSSAWHQTENKLRGNMLKALLGFGSDVPQASTAAMPR